MQTAHEFVVSEGIWIPGDDVHHELQLIREIVEERSRAATACLRLASGSTLSDPVADDQAGDMHPERAVVSRQWSQAAFGHGFASDWIMKARPDLMFTQGSPWEQLVKEAEPQIFLTRLDTNGSKSLLMSTPVDSACCPTWSPDASRIAFLEWRAERHTDALRWWLWEEHYESGQRRLLGVFDTDEYNLESIAYSPDGEWILLNVSDDLPRIVRVIDGTLVTLPEARGQAAWHPTAGPSCLLTARSTAVALELAIYDLATGRTQRVGSALPLTDTPIRMWHCSVSDDGRFLLGVSSSGWTQERMTMDRVPPHATIVDITDSTVSLPLPLTYQTPGVEREHAHPSWLRHYPRHHAAMQIADHLLSTATRMRVVEEDPQEQGQRARKFRAMQHACVRAERELQNPGWLQSEAACYAQAAERKAHAPVRNQAQPRAAAETGDDGGRRRGLFGRRRRQS